MPTLWSKADKDRFYAGLLAAAERVAQRRAEEQEAARQAQEQDQRTHEAAQD